MFCFKDIKSINQKVNLPLFQKKNISLYIKREDLIHPIISGNKFRKLKYNIKEAISQKKKRNYNFWRCLFKSSSSLFFCRKTNGT